MSTVELFRERERATAPVVTCQCVCLLQKILRKTIFHQKHLSSPGLQLFSCVCILYLVHKNILFTANKDDKEKSILSIPTFSILFHQCSVIGFFSPLNSQELSIRTTEQKESYYRLYQFKSRVQWKAEHSWPLAGLEGGASSQTDLPPH